MRFWSLIILLGMAAGLLAAGTHGVRTSAIRPKEAAGFVTNIYGQHLSWQTQFPIVLNVHESVPAEMLPAIQRAMDDWERAVGKKVFSLGNLHVAGNKALDGIKDGQNTIYLYGPGEWKGRKEDQAKTYISWVGDKLQEADIVINAADHNYSSAVDLKPRDLDLESAMVHELGHVLGLDHEDVRPSVMASWLSNGQQRRTVYKADVATVLSEYEL